MKDEWATERHGKRQEYVHDHVLGFPSRNCLSFPAFHAHAGQRFTTNDTRSPSPFRVLP